MTGVFSTRNQPSILCTEPVLTVSFPTSPCPCVGPNTVTLANGAVVDLMELGRIVGQLCPSVFCQPLTNVTAAAQVVSPITAPTTPAVVGSNVDP